MECISYPRTVSNKGVKPISNPFEIRISSGRLVDLSNFTEEDICLESISRSLNELKRFTGHWREKEPLTVAQHTGLTMRISRALYPDDVATYLLCLIHDFPEAYYGDLSSPLKRYLGSNLDDLHFIDGIITGKLFFFDKKFLSQAHERMKRCDNLSLRIEQWQMWGDDEYLSALSNVDFEFTESNPVDDWYTDIQNRHLYLDSTYLALKQRNESEVAA